MKKKYEPAEFEFVKASTCDVITTSNPGNKEDNDGDVNDDGWVIA